MMGAERRSMVMTEEDKLLTAYHEAGHAIVALNVPSHNLIHKATIIPHGGAPGMVIKSSQHNERSISQQEMNSRLAVMMGGRVAEELVFGRGKVTSGAASDIRQATELAQLMVTRWGLSAIVGAVSYSEIHDQVLIGMSAPLTRYTSEATAQSIDREIRRFVEDGYDHATRILVAKRADLVMLAAQLLVSETMTGEESIALLH